MAGIFDKKEEVLDFILTREGRKLFAEGKFKPAYYEFYDSEITYEANNDETQNDSKQRIKDGLYQQAIVSIDQINDLGGTVENDNSNLLKNPIGSYQTQNEYAPAWKISFNESAYLTNIFSTTQKDIHLTNIDDALLLPTGELKGVNTFEERIPQFHVNVNYKLYQHSENLKDGGTRTRLYFDNRNKDLLVALEEQNVFEPAETREFELEIFEIVENKNGTDPYTLKRLYFDEEDLDNLGTVERYFNVLLDEEVRFESNFKKKDIYSEIVADPEELCEPEQV